MEDNSVRELESRLQSLQLERDVPTEEVLLAARHLRDQGWQLVKAAWLGQAPSGNDQSAFIAEFSPRGTLATAYEQSVSALMSSATVCVAKRTGLRTRRSRWLSLSDIGPRMPHS